MSQQTLQPMCDRSFQACSLDMVCCEGGVLSALLQATHFFIWLELRILPFGCPVYKEIMYGADWLHTGGFWHSDRIHDPQVAFPSISHIAVELALVYWHPLSSPRPGLEQKFGLSA